MVSPPADVSREPLAPPRSAAVAQQAHPLLWRAHQLGRADAPAVPTGFSELDAELPGGGWPHRALTELLLPHAGVGEMRLLAPALAGIAGRGRCVMLFDPPAALSGWVLGQLGVDVQQLLVVYGREGARGAAVLRRILPSADLLWAMAEALKSGHVGAVLAWPPDRLRADAVRRLQLAAVQHEGPVFLFRDIAARLEASAAPLRLALSGAGQGEVSVRILKRRGPALARSLSLALPPVIAPALAARMRSARPAARPVPAAAGSAEILHAR